MEIENEGFPELNSYAKVRRLRRIAGFALFFCVLAMSLSGGNLFLEYTQALQNEGEIVMENYPAREIYKPLFASFQNEYERAIEKIVVDSIPEIEISHPASPPPPPEPLAEQKIGVYLHMNNTANPKVFRAEIEQLKKFENAALVFDVKGSYVYFDSNSATAKKYGLIKPLFELPEIIEELKTEGIYTIARVITVKDSEFSWKNQNVKLWNPKTGGVAIEWVDPANPEVLEYNREIISEILAAGIDEINLDFIRYPDKFTSNFLGITSAEKIENITNFVKMARETIDAEKPETILSVNTFAILAWDGDASEQSLGQDVVALAEFADIIAPMLYPNTFSRDNPNYSLAGKSFEYSTVFLTLEKYRELLGEEDAKKLRPWIQGYYTTKKNMTDQIEAVYDAGVCGFTVWDIKNDYSNFYKILQEMEIPEECLTAS